jgi:hypothetical protein
MAPGAEKLRHVCFVTERHDARLLGVAWQQIAWPHRAILLLRLDRMAAETGNKNKAKQHRDGKLS